jgi:hypothetical protein
MEQAFAGFQKGLDAVINTALKQFQDAQSQARKHAIPAIFGPGGEGDPRGRSFGDWLTQVAIRGLASGNQKAKAAALERLDKTYPETFERKPGKDLCTRARAYQELTGVSGVDSLIDTLVTAASDAVQKWCRRDFLTTSYDELYSGNGIRKLMLRQYPIVSVQSVRYRPVTALKMTHPLAAKVQAPVTATLTGLIRKAILRQGHWCPDLRFLGRLCRSGGSGASSRLGGRPGGARSGGTRSPLGTTNSVTPTPSASATSRTVDQSGSRRPCSRAATVNLWMPTRRPNSSWVSPCCSRS